MAFETDTVIKRTKGKMIMLYAIVDGEETHMASFFHENKAQFVLDALEDSAGVDVVDEDAPKKKPAKKKTTTGAKKPVKKATRKK